MLHIKIERLLWQRMYDHKCSIANDNFNFQVWFLMSQFPYVIRITKIMTNSWWKNVWNLIHGQSVNKMYVIVLLIKRNFTLGQNKWKCAVDLDIW